MPLGKNGSVRKVSNSSFVWHITELIGVIDSGDNYGITSPCFQFEAHRWFIVVYKCLTESGAALRLSLGNGGGSVPLTQTYRLVVTAIDGEHYRPSPVLRDTFEYLHQRGTPQDHPESDLLVDASRRAPGGDLYVHLEFNPEEGVDFLPAGSRPNTADCGTQTSPDQDLKLVPPGKSVLSGPNDIENLVQDLKDLLLSGQKSDVTLVVNGRELQAHQNILVARSSVFSAMLNKEWLEQASGTVQITDCDAEVFQDFLRYLYSGTVETLEVRNVVELFTIADKYDVKSLAKICVDFMISNLTVDSFCDFVPLALRHCELKLLESANRFFAENVKEIIATEKWKIFNRQNPDAASELLVKSMCQ